jgi:hypothetical protein
MKISYDKAVIMARVLERYYIYATRFMEKGLSNHPESLGNKNLFVETAEDIALVTEMYPAFSGGKTIFQGVQDRNHSTLLPDPARKNSFHPVLERLPGPENIEGDPD